MPNLKLPRFIDFCWTRPSCSNPRHGARLFFKRPLAFSRSVPEFIYIIIIMFLNYKYYCFLHHASNMMYQITNIHMWTQHKYANETSKNINIRETLAFNKRCKKNKVLPRIFLNWIFQSYQEPWATSNRRESVDWWKASTSEWWRGWRGERGKPQRQRTRSRRWPWLWDSWALVIRSVFVLGLDLGCSKTLTASTLIDHGYGIPGR